jgi:hypothetical protein
MTAVITCAGMFMGDRFFSEQVAGMLRVSPHQRHAWLATPCKGRISRSGHGGDFTMNTVNIKRAIALLREMADLETLEQRQRNAILNTISGLRRARRSHDPAKILQAVNSVCKIFLPMHDR